MKFIILSIFVFLLAGDVFAVADAPLIIQARIAEQKVDHAMDLKFLTEFKIISDKAIEMNKSMGDLYDQYNYVMDFSFVSKIRQLQQSIENLDQFSDFGSLSNEGKFKRVRRIMRQRFKANPQANKRVDSKLTAAEALRARRLEKEKSRETLSINPSVKSIELQRDTADSLSILAIASLKKQEKELEAEVYLELEKEKAADNLRSHFSNMKNKKR